jgi:hypothetical protein
VAEAFKNIIDYVWEQRDSFAERPLCRVDSLVFSQISYFQMPTRAEVAWNWEGLPITELWRTDWLDEMVGPLACGDAACVGAKATRADGSIACAGYLVGAGHLLARAYEGYPARATGYYEYNVLPHRAAAVSGACLMARRSDLAGGLDEDLPTTFDVALCLRLARAGGAVLQQNNASVTLADAPIRRTSAGGRAEGARELALLANRFRDELARSDPYYTPNVARGNVFFGYVEGASRR